MLGLPKNPTPSIPSLSKNPTPSIPRMSKNPTPSISSLSKNPTYVPSIPKVDMADKCSVSRSLTKQAGKLSVGTYSNIQFFTPSILYFLLFNYKLFDYSLEIFLTCCTGYPSFHTTSTIQNGSNNASNRDNKIIRPTEAISLHWFLFSGMIIMFISLYHI